MVYPQHNILSDVPRGYELNPLQGLFSVILPEATTNMVVNPSFERDTNNYALSHVGSTIARSDEQQRWGTYSGKVTPTSATTSGAYYGALSLTAGQPYTASVYFRGAPGQDYRLFFSTGDFAVGSVMGTAKSFRGTGRWQYIWVTYTELSTNTNRRVYITKNGGSATTPFYIDGLQVENKPYPTTYVDGDMTGFIKNQTDFFWNGTPHASTSSRSATTRAGGKVVSFDAYRFALIGLIGLGMNAIVNTAQPYTLIGGSNYQRTVAQDRLFTLAGQLDADTPQHLKRLRKGLENALDVNLSGKQQQILLRYQDYKDTDPMGDPLDVVSAYVDGLGGNTDNNYAERVGIQFVSYLPYLQSAYESGVQLDISDSISNANGVLQRSPLGAWAALGTGISGGGGTVNAVVIGPDGKIYIGGDFASVGGVANTARIAYWDPTDLAWHAMGTGGSGGDVNALAVGPDGTIYAAGTFTSMGSVADTLRIAFWNGSGWGALGTGINGTVKALAISADGGVFAGGSFTDAGGVTVANIAKWNSPSWAVLGTGVNNTVEALAYAGWGELYVGGIFTTAGGSSANRAAKWDGVTWTALGSGMGNNTVEAMLVAPNGWVYATGNFTTADGITVNGIAYWNGTSWNKLADAGFSSGGGFALAFDGRGNLYIGGTFNGVGGIEVPDGIALWNGSAWAPVDVIPSGTATIRAIAFARDGTLTIGFNHSGTATVAGVVTATNNGTAPSWAKIRFIGSGRIYSLINYTTGKAIYFDLTLNDTEEAVLDLTPDRITFTSTWRGNILNTILPGSDLATWRLEQGGNEVSLLVTNTSAGTEASMWWRENYKSINGATP